MDADARGAAVVGMALRAPGGITETGEYWSAIRAGRVLLGPLPEQRRRVFGDAWDVTVTRGGYLDDPFAFDAGFFGISPREARVTDPQQRVLLETVWEAFENAAVVPRSAAERTGVFVGITGQDYRRWFQDEPGSHWTAGNGLSFAAGRVAHVLGLGGPVFAVDTACSSSMVALHSACRSLAAGDCDVAVAAGVNLILAPWTTLALERTGALSLAGSSRPFDAGADGFVRAEGCAALILKRPRDAERDHDRVHAYVDGIAVNHDGHASSFAAPNEVAQTRLIRGLLESLEIEPADIGYHEAHGTGTPVGDRVELRAVSSALGRLGPALYLGSVKANLGHAEAASGLLGLIKAVLCLRHRWIPPQAGYDKPVPEIDLEAAGLAVCAEGRPWATQSGARASVSSYGMSGTNVFAVLSGPPARRTQPAEQSVTAGFMVSACSLPALRELAARYSARLGAQPADYAAFADTATRGRSRLRHTAWIAADDAVSAVAALDALAAGAQDERVLMIEPSVALPGVGVGVRAATDIPTYPWRKSSYAVLPVSEA